jgi:hypothetical protein
MSPTQGSNPGYPTPGYPTQVSFFSLRTTSVPRTNNDEMLIAVVLLAQEGVKVVLSLSSQQSDNEQLSSTSLESWA